MAGGGEEKPYGLRYHKHIPFTWEVCRLVWRKERRLLSWGSRRAAFGGAARAACLSTRSSLVHSRKLCQRSVCGAEWWLLRELIQVKNNFLGMVGGTRAQLRGTAGGHRKEQRSWEPWQLPWLSTTIRGNAERKLSLRSRVLLLPAVLQRRPSAPHCCLFLLLLSPRSYYPSWAAAGVNPSSLGSKWAELVSRAKS